jgi:hypothetical protein
LNLSKNEEISLSIQSRKVVREEVGSKQKALEILSETDSVKSFSYSEGVLEAVVNE